MQGGVFLNAFLQVSLCHHVSSDVMMMSSPQSYFKNMQRRADVIYHDLVCMLMELAKSCKCFCILLSHGMFSNALSVLLRLRNSWAHCMQQTLVRHGTSCSLTHYISLYCFNLQGCRYPGQSFPLPCRSTCFFPLIFGFSFSGTMDVWTWSRNSSLQVPPRLAVLVSPVANACSVQFG